MLIHAMFSIAYILNFEAQVPQETDIANMVDVQLTVADCKKKCPVNQSRPKSNCFFTACNSIMEKIYLKKIPLIFQAMQCKNIF